jgi:O-antigen ligase
MNPHFREKVQTTAGLFKGDYQQANQATSNRLPIWRVSVKVFEDHWLNGIGPRGFRYIYPTYAEADDIWIRQNPNQGPTHPHQFTLEIAVETGIIGLVGFGIFWIWIIRRWWSARADAYNPQLPWLAALGVGMLPLNAGHALYASFWSGIVFWLLAVTVALHGPTKTTSPASN